jgi:hypothetical protein
MTLTLLMQLFPRRDNVPGILNTVVAWTIHVTWDKVFKYFYLI